MFIFLLVFLLLIGLVVLIIDSSCKKNDTPSSPADSSAHEPESKHNHSEPEHNLPDWEDLSDDEKTKLSVWSEKGGPLEDLHLFE